MTDTSYIREKIRTRGYWQVVIRPSRYQANKVANILDLPRILERSKVSFRGWDFPHLDRRHEPDIKNDYAEQATDWDMHVEYWRFHQSGQFVHLNAFIEDWASPTTLLRVAADWKPVKRFLVLSNLFRFTEIYEFASRLAVTAAGDDSMNIEIQLHLLAGRTLLLGHPDRVPFVSECRASIPDFTHQREYSTKELASQTRELALTPALELFRRFNWDVSLESLKDLQSELFKASA